MKIAIIGPFYPYRGGISTYNERLALEYQNEGHEVTAYTFTLQYPDFLFPGKTQYQEEEGPDNLHIVRCINSVNPLNWIQVGNRLKKERPDLLIIRYWLPFMGPCFGTILRRIKKNKHTRIVCLADNIIPHESRPGDRIFTSYFIKPVDAFVAMSRSVLSDIDSFDSSKVKTLSPHPLFDNFGELMPREEALQKLDLDPSNRYLLFFGLIREYKGLDLLLKAISDERLKKENIKLIIAGEYYSNQEDYQAIIQEHNLQDQIFEVNKFIPNAEVKYFFNAADLVVQPYKSATQSGVTQIAYHFNKPMVVTNVGGLAEFCPDGKVGYVTNKDPKDIADAILRFYHEADQETFVQNVMEQKKKFSWDILARNIMKVSGLER